MSTDPFADPQRYFLHGRLEQMPRRRTDRTLVLRYVADRVFHTDDSLTEPELTARLADLARDPVDVRLGLVEAGLVSRMRDGAEYWRAQAAKRDEG